MIRCLGYYLQAGGRADMKVVPLYDPHYVPQDGDFIVLEPSRRFIETQRFFDVLGNSDMLHSEVRVGPVMASTIYLFDSSAQGTRSREGGSTLTRLYGSTPRFDTNTQKAESAGATSFDPSHVTRRLMQ